MKLLTLNTAILAAGDLTETSDSIQSSDAIYPKHVIPGWQIVEAPVPEGFTPAGYAWEGGQVVAKPEPPEILKAKKDQKWSEIKSSRDLRKSGGVLVDNKWFHTDADSRIQQLGLVLMGASVPAVQWKTMDGTFTTMSSTLATQIFQAVATLDMNLFAVAETHRTNMESSTNPDQYDFSQGWPEHFPI